jgi:hypothetical protein
MAESVEEQQFPHPELSPLSSADKPTNASLKPLKKQLNANAMSIPSVQGGGAHGHLALTIPAASYLALTGIAFVAPLHHGPVPIHAVAATGPKSPKQTANMPRNSKNTKSTLPLKPT